MSNVWKNVWSKCLLDKCRRIYLETANLIKCNKNVVENMDLNQYQQQENNWLENSFKNEKMLIILKKNPVPKQLKIYPLDGMVIKNSSSHMNWCEL